VFHVWPPIGSVFDRVTQTPKLLFALDDPTPDAVTAVEDFFRRLNEQRAWTEGEVQFVNEVDASSVTRQEDQPVWTVGGVLALTDPSGDPDTEQSQLADVEFLIERLREFSRDGYTFVVEYGGEEVGSVADGNMDESLRSGLLRPWRERTQGP
jgi:hypothetical protein